MKVTVYRKGEFGNIIKHECHFVSVLRRKYAQYNNAIELTVRYPRKRSNTTHMITYMPYIVIVEGWNKPDPADLYDKVEVKGDVTVKSSSRMSFDPAFCSDFDSVVKSGKLGNIIFDARHTSGDSCY